MSSPRVVFLGTGGALNPERYQASILVDGDPARVLLDTGGGLGVVQRLLAAGVDPSGIGHVFLSHRHLDHAGGLEAFLLTLFHLAARAGRAPGPVRVYALAETAAAVRATRAAADGAAERLLDGRLAWVSPAPGAHVALEDGLGLRLVSVDHPPPGGGAAGCVVELGSGRVAYSGDTRPSLDFAAAAAGADLILHEVGGLDAKAGALHAIGHSTAGDAGRIATRAGARALALVHLPDSRSAAPADLLAEARRFAPGIEVVLAEDGMILPVA